MAGALDSKRTIGTHAVPGVGAVHVLLAYVALTPLLLSVELVGYRATGLLAPAALVVGIFAILADRPGLRASQADIFQALYFSGLVWAAAVTFYRAVPIDDYTSQQMISYALFSVSVGVGLRARNSISGESAISWVLRTGMVFTILNVLMFLLGLILSTWDYLFSPVIPALVTASSLPWLRARPASVSFIFVVNIIVVLASGNRTIPAVLVAAVFAAVLTAWIGRPVRSWAIASGGSLALAAFVFFNPGMIPWGTGRWHGGDASVTIGQVNLNTNGRQRIWEYLWNVGDSYQPLGAGIGSASRAVDTLVAGIEHPHNEYMRLWLDAGIIGLSVFFAAIAAAFVGLTLRLNEAAAVSRAFRVSAIFALASTAAIMITLNPLVNTAAMTWIGLVIGFAFARPAGIPRDPSELTSVVRRNPDSSTAERATEHSARCRTNISRIP